MDEYVKHNLENLKSMREMAGEGGDSWGDQYGPFIWVQDIWSLEDGLYRKVGKLSLPMTGECEPVPERLLKEPERSGWYMFTCFSDAYFEEGCIDNLVQQFPRGRSVIDFKDMQPSKVFHTETRELAITGIRSQIANYFKVRKAVLAGDVGEFFDGTEEMRNRVLECYYEIER